MGDAHPTRLIGGDGNDVLLSVSDSNAPVESVAIGQTVADLTFKTEFYNPDNLEANDRLTGGAGADTFKFDLLMNAKQEIYTRHQSDSLINWGMGGVADKNEAYHDHWVEGIGFDVITDFSGHNGQGHHIVITGHTVTHKGLADKQSTINPRR